MTILPVLDLLDGTAVRGVAGKRDLYRPVQSVLAPPGDPVALARAYGEQLGLSELYLADLDAIVHGRPNLPLYRSLSDSGITLLVDAGLRQARQAVELLDCGVAALVAGLETISGPAVLRDLVLSYGPDRVVFSLDLLNGRPLSDTALWETSDPLAIAQRAIAERVERMIVLDLAAVGMDGGPATVQLCRVLRRTFPSLQIITGGGVRDLDDVRVLIRSGADQVLVASALHDGTLRRQEIDSLSRESSSW